MTKKRYAIVRVKHICPLFENNELCDTAKNCFSCKIKTNYGDTKEQLVLKVSQALRRKLKDDKLVYIGLPKKRNIRIETLAKEIVEFLGVEE